jgi:hypothetical protein
MDRNLRTLQPTLINNCFFVTQIQIRCSVNGEKTIAIRVYKLTLPPLDNHQHLPRFLS